MHTCTRVKTPTKFGVNWSHFNFGIGMGRFRLGGDTSIDGLVRTDNLGNLHSHICVSQIYILKKIKKANESKNRPAALVLG